MNKKQIIIMTLFFLPLTAHASLDFQSVALGDKTTAPGQSYDIASSTQNVLFICTVTNTAGSAKHIRGSTFTFAGTTDMSAFAPGTLRLIESDDLTIEKSEMAQADAGVVKGNQVWFDLASPPINLTGGETAYLFVVYDTSSTAAGGAVLDARIADPSDIEATDTVDFQGASYIDSSGQDTVEAPLPPAAFEFTSVDLGAKTTAPGQPYSLTSSTQNVLFACSVANTGISEQLIGGFLFTFTGTTDMNVLAPGSLRLIRSDDLVIDSSELAQADVGAVDGTQALFDLSSSCITFTGSETVNLFLVYDTSSTAVPGAVLDVRLASETHIKADALVDFQGESFIDSAGQDTVDITASVLRIETVGAQTAGIPFDVTVVAEDDYGNKDMNAFFTVQIVAAENNPALLSPNGDIPLYPSAQTLINGETLISDIVLYHATNTVRIGVSSPNLFTSGTVDSDLFTVLPGTTPVLEFLPVTTPQKSGVPFDVYVLAAQTEIYGNAVPLSAYDGLSVLVNGDSPAPPETTPTLPVYSGAQTFGQAGVVETATFTVTLYQIERNRQLHAQMSGHARSSVNSNAFDVLSSGLLSLQMQALSVVTAGVPFVIDVTVLDDSNNEFPAYNGQLVYEINGQNIFDPDAPVTPVESLGPAWFVAKQAGNYILTVRDNMGSVPASVMLNVYPGAPTQVSFQHPLDTAPDTPFWLQINLTDAFGNPADYSGPGVISITKSRFVLWGQSAQKNPVKGIQVMFSEGKWQGQVSVLGEATDTGFMAAAGNVSGRCRAIRIQIDEQVILKPIMYPNPFRPSHGQKGMFRFSAHPGAHVRLSLATVDGRIIREWSMPADQLGSDAIKSLEWDGRDKHGHRLPAGVYFFITDVNGTVKKNKFAVIH